MSTGPLKLKSGSYATPYSAAARELFARNDRFRLELGDGSANHILAVKHEIAGTTAPSVNDDAGDGFSAGSTWTDVTNNKSYTCTNPAVGAAVWKQTGGTGAGGSYSAGSGLTLSGSTFAVDSSLVPFLASANTFSAKQIVSVNDASNSTATELLDLVHTTSGTAAAGIGGRFRIRAEDASGSTQTLFQVLATLSDASGSWKAYNTFYAFDSNNGRAVINMQATGAAGAIGFLEAAPSAQLASPDVGTALNTFGLTSGTPTFAAANLTGHAAAMPVFVAAGGSHAKGAVPDPGATAHTNHPFILNDAAAFVVPNGKILASNIVTTSEGTTSGTFGDLATLDRITFTLDATQTVILVYHCNCFNSAATGVCLSQFEVDGTDNTSVNSIYTSTANNAPADCGMKLEVSLAAGAHTIDVEHSRLTTGTSNFRFRYLYAILKG